MSRIVRGPTIRFAGRDWLISQGAQGAYANILDAILGQLAAMMSHHNKLLMCRFDLHVPDSSPDNRRITDFLRRLSGRLKASYKLKRIGYIWVREQNSAPAEHYHLALILNGNCLQHSGKLWELVQACWAYTEGHCYLPKHPYYRIKRDSDEMVAGCIYRLSYLAKCFTKGHKPIQTKNYGASRIKAKQANEKI